MSDAREEAQSARRALVVLAMVVGAAVVVLLTLPAAPVGAAPRAVGRRGDPVAAHARVALAGRAARRHVDGHGPHGFDYALRRWLWFPLFGHEELGLPLPSLCLAMLTPLVVGAVAYRVLARGGRAPRSIRSPARGSPRCGAPRRPPESTTPPRRGCTRSSRWCR